MSFVQYCSLRSYVINTYSVFTTFTSTTFLRNLTQDKKLFNYVLSSTRVKSEHAFGILTQTFGIYEKQINMNINTIEDVVLATIALHNFRRKTSLTAYNEYNEETHLNSVNQSTDENFESDFNANSLRDYLCDFVQRN